MEKLLIILDKIASKAISGRFLLTLSCAYVFIYASSVGILHSDAVASIVGMVFIAYFKKEKAG